MKKIISMAICLIMILSLVQLPAFADDTGYYEDTDGSIVITTPAGWTSFIEPYNLTNKTILDKTVYLECDLTIGSSNKSMLIKQVTGKIIGRKNHETGNPATIYFGYKGYPFIDTLQGGAEISYLAFEPIPGSESTPLAVTGPGGILVGTVGSSNTTYNGTAKISYVTNNIDVVANNITSASKYRGGLVGCARSASVEFSNCVNNGDITGAQDVAGGIIGYTYRENENTVTIKNCINTGNISAVNNAGGMIGNLLYTTIIEECVNKGNITSTTKNAGGIVGGTAYVANLKATSITKCYNEGSVNAAQAGGIAGQINAGNNAVYNGTFVIENCYNTGAVSATGNAAGIIPKLGNNIADTQKINNCYNIGVITGETTNWGICAALKAAEGKVEFNNNYSLYSNCDSTGETNDVVYNGDVLLANTQAGYEKVNKLGSAYISMQGSYPVLIDNLPVDENLSPISTYKVTLTNGANGTASKDAETLVKAGEKYTVTVEPVSGYQVASYSDTLEQISENSFATIVPVTSDMSVSIDYEEIPASEGITSEQDYLYDVYEDAEYGFNLLCFAKFIPANNVTAFGIQLLDENKNVIHEGDALSQNGHTNGQFGVRFFGAGIDSDKTYYLRPYVQYGEDEPIYADYITYTK